MQSTAYPPVTRILLQPTENYFPAMRLSQCSKEVLTMSRFTVVLGKLGQGYRVEIIGADGARQTVLGFSSESEANEWIKLEQHRERLMVPTHFLDAAD